MSRFRSQLSLAAVVAGGLLVVSSATARAAVPSGNLIVNGGAEVGTGPSDSATTAPAPIPGWTTTANLTEHTYDPAGSQNFPTRTRAPRSVARPSSSPAGGERCRQLRGNRDADRRRVVRRGSDRCRRVRSDAVRRPWRLRQPGGSGASHRYVPRRRRAATWRPDHRPCHRRGSEQHHRVAAADRHDPAAAGHSGDSRNDDRTKFAGAYNDAYLDNISL